MSERSTETTVTFAQPFTLKSCDAALPPGTYRLVIDDEEILGLSFLAYRRTATTRQTPSVSVRPGYRQAIPVEPGEMEGALKADNQGLAASFCQN
jgi:hypothetical protein